jgi:ferric-dicitrate binding protein FerR (iron transport regulator)
MSDLTERLERAGQALQPEWSEARAHAAFDGVERRRRRRAWARGTALALVAVGLAWLQGHRDTTLVRFADHSTAQLLDAQSVVRRGDASPERVVALLERGGARFEVVRDPQRQFRVEAGPVAVEVLGTVFTVERNGDRSRVQVERGRVRVRYQGGERFLEAGQGGLFPPEDEVGALLAAADRARLDHAPERALPPLQEVIARHSSDPRAPLAAFTLGRLYEQAGRRGEAAEAFGRSAALDPNGPLAADARSRERALRPRP